jgi:predicted nucleic acid-binding protein
LTAFVLDASVAAKWYLPRDEEQHVAEAFDLLRANTLGRCPFIVPDLFWSELTHLFVKAVRRKRISAQHAEVSLRNARGADIVEFQAQKLVDRALALATAHGVSGYDAIYVALAEVIGAPLVTADRRLADAISPVVPVRWLGSMQP